MVAISLYRGNLHRVPDVPRRWLMPTHPISLKLFKSLLTRRLKALSRHHPITTTTTTTSNPNPNSNSNSKQQQQQEECANDKGCSNSEAHGQSQLEEPGKVSNPEEGTSKDEETSGEVKHHQGSDGDDHLMKPVDGSALSPRLKIDAPDNASDPVDGNGNSQAMGGEKLVDSANPNAETGDKVNALNDRQKRKREVEEKLQILNAKKHDLVQVLKQILNADEEWKRRTSMQGLAIRPPPLQIGTTTDSGSMTRHVAPRMGLDANLGGDMEGGEADDVSNHNMHSRHLLRMSSTSPSSESPLRRAAYFQHNAVPHPSRASLGTTVSPSRFAPMGQQGHPSNLPTVSVSGTNYIASSPSPAASGSTSVFRDARLPSPWN